MSKQQGETCPRESVNKNDFRASGVRVLVRHLLLGMVQRPVGKIGVHPSTPIDENTYRKLLKNKELTLFQNGEISLLLLTGNTRA